MIQGNKHIDIAYQSNESLHGPTKLLESFHQHHSKWRFLHLKVLTCNSSAVLNDSWHKRHLFFCLFSWKARMWPSKASWFGASSPHSWHRFGSIEWHFRCNFKRYRLLNHSPQIVHISLLFSSFFARFCGSSEWWAWMCFRRWLAWRNPLPQMSQTCRAPVVFPKWINCSWMSRFSSDKNLWTNEHKHILEILSK